MKRILVLIFAALLLFGCVDVKIQQVIQKDGSSTVTETLDLSALTAMMNRAGSENASAHLAFVPSFNQICVNATREGADDCKADLSSSTIVLTKKFTASSGKAFYQFTADAGFPFITYTFTADKMPMAVDLSKASDSLGQGSLKTPNPFNADMSFSNAAAKQSAAMMQAVNAHMTYEIEVPGEITSAPGGTLSGSNTVAFDMFQLMHDGQSVRIQSQELNTPLVGGVTVGILLVLGVAFFFLRRKR